MKSTPTEQSAELPAASSTLPESGASRVDAPPPANAGRAVPATLDFALLRGALEEVPFGVATTRNGVLYYANDALGRIFGTPQGGLEQRPISQLFTAASYAEIARGLDATRCFDGHVRGRAADGREFDAEAHIEWYTSEAQGRGGFLVVRDVTSELGALGRLADQLGGALFRVRVETGALEMISPAIGKLTGVDAVRCTQRPVILTTLVSTEERERLAFLYRRMIKGELSTANARVSLRRPDGITRLVNVRATARRDGRGVVRYIEGVVLDAARDPEATGARRDTGRAEDVRDPAARATMDLSYELLREASQHVNALVRELRTLRAALRTTGSSLPPDALAELVRHVDGAALEAGATAALNRGVRHALARATMGAPLGEVLEAVRAALAPVTGERRITVSGGDAGHLVIPERVDEITLALTFLGLRAFRFAGSGSLTVTAQRAATPRSEARPRRVSSPGIPAVRSGGPVPEREHVLIEILGSAPPDLADASGDGSGDVTRIPRPDEANLAHSAAQTLIHWAGGAVEIDDATFSTARTVVRLRL